MASEEQKKWFDIGYERGREDIIDEFKTLFNLFTAEDYKND